MIEKDGQEYYTMNEVANIFTFGYGRIRGAVNARLLIPDEMKSFKGVKFRYLFSRQEIERYGKRIGVDPIWENVNDPLGLPVDDVEHEKKVMDARREVRKIVDPVEAEKDIVITSDNVREVFNQIQKGKQEMEAEPTSLYIVKIGKGYLEHGCKLSEWITAECLFSKESAYRMQDMFGGAVMQIYLKEVEA